MLQDNLVGLRARSWADHQGAPVDLVFAWFDILDLLGHTCIVRCRGELEKAYRDVQEIYLWAKRVLPDSTAVLVLSDHGIEISGDGVSGKHNSRGFWSLNKEPSLRPQTPEDIHRLIHRLLE